MLWHMVGNDFVTLHKRLWSYWDFFVNEYRRHYASIYRLNKCEENYIQEYSNLWNHCFLSQTIKITIVNILQPGYVATSWFHSGLLHSVISQAYNFFHTRYL